MAITPDRVREIFKGLENGDGAASFEQVVDDVDWAVMDTHPWPVTTLAKTLHSGSREGARQDLSDLYCGFSRERAAYRPVDRGV